MPQPYVAIQPAEKRTRNFNEVSLGYSKKVAIEESRRCPQCAEALCTLSCPLHVDIPGFIRLLREGNTAASYQTITQTNCLPSICGRICSAPCERACVLNKEHAPIGIRALERYVAEFGRSRQTKPVVPEKRGKKIAIVGSGPSGLVAAAELAARGYAVTIYEAFDKAGGVLRYGVPEFRVPKRILDSEINDIKALGVTIEPNVFVGQTVTLAELKKQGCVAVLIATGAGVPRFVDIPGANLGGVYYGEEFLVRINMTKANVFSHYIPTFALGNHVAVVGSGNTALDCARAAVRFGRKVTLLFKRSEEEMRVRSDERFYGKAEGVTLLPLTRMVEIVGGKDTFVTGLKCIRMEYVGSKIRGSRELRTVAGSEFLLDVDTVVIAVGHKPNSYIHIFSPEVAVSEKGTICVDEETGMTSLDGVFACGNVVSDSGPLIDAMASGKHAAECIDAYVRK